MRRPLLARIVQVAGPLRGIFLPDLHQDVHVVMVIQFKPVGNRRGRTSTPRGDRRTHTLAMIRIRNVSKSNHDE